MTDITKCSGNNCSKKFTCYRYLASDNGAGQSYLMEPSDCYNNEFSMYWPIKKKRSNRVARVTQGDTGELSSK